MPLNRVQKLSTIVSLDETDGDIYKLSQLKEDDDIFIEQKPKYHMSEQLLKRTAEIDKIINSIDIENYADNNDEKPSYDETGKRTYERACAKLGVNTISQCVRCLDHGSVLDIPFYGLSSKNALALSMALVINSSITTVSLQGNNLTSTELGYLEKMLDENLTITHLNISENNPGAAGAQCIARIIENNKTLRHLNLSNNNFYDSEGIILAKAVEEYSELHGLNLSHNNFSDASAFAFKSMLAENSCLQEIDLSWNHFLRGGAIVIADGLSENVCIKYFNASWNGFEDDGAFAMARAIENNTVVKTIDLSCNRIGPEGFMTIITAFKQNNTLDTLKIGKNNIPDQAAITALEYLSGLSSLTLRTLDLSDVIFRQSFDNSIKDFLEIHKDLQVVHGYTDSYGKRRMVSYNAAEDAIGLIRAYLVEHNVTIVELFSRFDVDGSQSVSYEEFEQGLKEAGILLSPTQLDLMIKKLDKDNDGEIDFSELVALQLQQTETLTVIPTFQCNGRLALLAIRFLSLTTMGSNPFGFSQTFTKWNLGITESATYVSVTENVLTSAEVATNTLLGFCLYCNKFSTKLGRSIFLEDLYVTPNSNREEIGKLLMKRLAKICVDKGYKRVVWTQLKRNDYAISFYTKDTAFNLSDKRGLYFYSLSENKIEKLLEIQK